MMLMELILVSVVILAGTEVRSVNIFHSKKKKKRIKVDVQNNYMPEQTTHLVLHTSTGAKMAQWLVHWFVDQRVPGLILYSYGIFLD